MIENLIKIIKEEFIEIENQDFNSDTLINEVIPFSSLNIAILLTCIEMEYDKIIKPIELKKCNTIGELYELIMSK